MKKFLIKILFILSFLTNFETSAEEFKYTNEQWNLYDVMDTCNINKTYLKCLEAYEKLYDTFPSESQSIDNWMYHEIRYWLADLYFSSKDTKNLPNEEINKYKEKAIIMWNIIFNDPQYKKDNWYKLASAVALGWNYYVQSDFRDFDKAFKFMKYAADHDFHWAINNLGVFYDQGRAVKQDYKKAYELYNKAADLGNNWSHGNIAVLYTFGLGVKKNYERAIIHLKLARIEWAYASDEFSELMVLFEKKRLPVSAKEYMSWIESYIIKNQSKDDFQTLAWLSDIDDSVEDPLVTEYKWQYVVTKISKETDLIIRADQEIKFLEEFKMSEKEVVLAKKLAEDWIIKNWKN